MENPLQIRGKSKFVYSQQDQDSKTAISDAAKYGTLAKSGLGIRTLDPFHTIFGDSGHEQYYIHLCESLNVLYPEEQFYQVGMVQRAPLIDMLKTSIFSVTHIRTQLPEV
jgi:hypothetical protein